MISRRDLLKVAGAAAASVAADRPDAAASAPADAPAREAAHGQPAAGAASAGGPLQALTADEADLLTAIVARLIPADATGPGAVEAGAITYIDRALAGALSDDREAYRLATDAWDNGYCIAGLRAFITVPLWIHTQYNCYVPFCLLPKSALNVLIM